MAHVCPWWLGYALVSPLRRLVQSPSRVLAPYVREGMVVLEPGCGMGFFTLELARRVGPTGRVVAVDLQPRMVGVLRRRAGRAGLAPRVDVRIAEPNCLGLADLARSVDLVVAIYVVHEVCDQDRLFSELAATLRPTGRVLVAEPAWHVTEAAFAASLGAAGRAGLGVADRPRIGRDRTALLTPP